MKKIKIIIDNDAIKKYEKYYFKLHPRAHVSPIKQPYHESMNVWMIMKRPMMNALKGKWRSFIVWLIEDKGYSNLKIQKCEMEFITYYGNNRKHDVDNSTPKFIIDGLRDSGIIEDDCSDNLTKLILSCHSDVEYPRTEIIIKIKE